MDKKVQIVKGEEIRPEAKFFTMRDTFLLFKVDRARLDGIRKKLEKAQKARNPKNTVEKVAKEIIIKALKFDKNTAIENVQAYAEEPPSLKDIVESMTVQLHGEIKFKPESDGQKKLTDAPEKPFGDDARCQKCHRPYSEHKTDQQVEEFVLATRGRGRPAKGK